MTLGPYPRGDADGMRSLARRIRFRAAIIRNSPGMIADDFRALPIKAPFFDLAGIRMMTAGVLGSGAAGRLESIAGVLETKADEVEADQRRWRAQRDRLEAEAAEARKKAQS